MENHTKIDKNDGQDIYFAGGCFWGVEEYFSRMPGVYDVTSGYANGIVENPTYEQVVSQKTGHAETVHVRYNPKIIDIKTLVRQFFMIIDPTSKNKQGNDVGTQYRSGIYYVNDDELPILQKIFAEIQKKYNRPIVTELKKLENYFLAEDYHQDYLKKNPGGYCHIDFANLPDIRHAVSVKTFTEPDFETVKSILSDEEFDIIYNGGTEAPFTGKYENHKEAGIYVDVLTGEPLFSSNDKFDSGSGWPSFTKPIVKDSIDEFPDTRYAMNRVEVKSHIGNAHLGHVFDDGPTDKGGLRYCINSAALRFIAYEDMDEQGYGEYKIYVNR